MSNLAIIPARSGSKGIKDKNIYLLNGKPLLAYTIENTLHSRYVDEVMVSTDSTVYASVAKEYGAQVPFLRIAGTSTDTAKTIDVIFEVLEQYEKIGCCFDNVAILQPTSPLRTYRNIDDAFELFIEKNADSVVSVCECEHNPLLSNILAADLNLSGFIKSSNDLRRQELGQYYRLNGAIYISKVDVLRKIQSFYGRNSYAYVMQQMESVDIDSELDLEYAEFLIKKHTNKYNTADGQR